MAGHVAGRTIETDYLVVGCGAAGMAFTDALIDACDADVVMVDRRHAPGGHWNDAYPFVRLHQPSLYYGVNSLPLGTDTIERSGPNRGWYERATAAEICGYYDRVMQQRLLASGRVRWFPMSDYLGNHRFRSRLSGTVHDVTVRRQVVDARYLEAAVPATTPPPFEVEAGVRCVPVGALVSVAEPPAGYVIIGAGKTALDACSWLLDNDVPPGAIRWIKPRESWFLNREFAQGGELVPTLFDGLARQLAAAAEATSLDDLFTRLEAAGQVLRIDPDVTPTMFRGATISVAETEQLRRVAQVVRLGRIRRIERDAVIADGGTIPTGPDQLHVHCAAAGLSATATVPIFGTDTITLQSIRTGLLPFAAAAVGYVAATRRSVEEQNRLCPPSRQPNVPLDWVRGTLVTMKAQRRWSAEPDIGAWLDRARLNPMRGLQDHAAEPAVQDAARRFAASARPGLANLERLVAQAES